MVGRKSRGWRSAEWARLVAGAVSPLEDDDDFEPLGDDPLLQLNEFAMQASEFTLVGFPRQRAVPLRSALFPFLRSLIWPFVAAMRCLLFCLYFTPQPRHVTG